MCGLNPSRWVFIINEQGFLYASKKKNADFTIIETQSSSDILSGQARAHKLQKYFISGQARAHKLKKYLIVRHELSNFYKHIS